MKLDLAQRTETALDGVLVVNKPAGWTSHDVVARARVLLGVAKVGHTGTLDPAATGVLVLCLGKATRIAEYLVNADKEYRAVLRLGIATDTQDATGRGIGGAGRRLPGRAAIDTGLGRLAGQEHQGPPPARPAVRSQRPAATPPGTPCPHSQDTPQSAWPCRGTAPARRWPQDPASPCGRPWRPRGGPAPWPPRRETSSPPACSRPAHRPAQSPSPWQGQASCGSFLMSSSRVSTFATRSIDVSFTNFKSGT